MLIILRQVTVVLGMFVIICGVIYPAVVTGISKITFASKTEGSLIKNESGTVIGSELIGQQFTSHKYFWGRLSATSPVAYNASASSGSNLSNSSAVLLDSVKARIDALKNADPENALKIPADLVTASASGLDPHISVAAATYQANRVAKIRGLSSEKVQEFIDKYTTSRIMGVIGEPVVNVLKLNLALDGKI
jgi:K+-transporting ATPase ATPase C chain